MPHTSYTTSQNFTVSPALLDYIAHHIPTDITVGVDIGAATGIFSRMLAKSCTRVIAIEPDIRLYESLVRETRTFQNIQPVNAVFSASVLPSEPFIIVSNIPFSITAAIIKTIAASSFLQEAIIIVQKEAAQKFGGYAVGAPRTLASSLLEIDFEASILYECKPTDFTPSPRVSSVIFSLRRAAPAVPLGERVSYVDFIYYISNKATPFVGNALKAFNVSPVKKKRFSELSFKELYSLYRVSLPFATKYRGYAARIQKEQGSLQKIHRSRTDENWKRFR